MLKIKSFQLGDIETNCYVAYDSDTREGILVDPGFPDDTVWKFIADNGIKIKFTVNTHGHYDHIGGNHRAGYPVLIHKDDKDCLTNPLKSFAILSGDPFHPVKPHRLLKDADSIDVSGLSFKVIHTPGHTAGSISLECGGVIITGDTLFAGGVGRTDLPGGSYEALEKSLKKLLLYGDDTVIYPGHGPSSTIGEEKRNNPFIK